MVVAQNIRCSRCGAPVEFKPGDSISKCAYCGFTIIIETGKAFNFQHLMLINKCGNEKIEATIPQWMTSGFLKPPNLNQKAKFLELDLIYLPFWVVSILSKTACKRIFERISPPVAKDGEMQKEYDCLVLARETTIFPTREYTIPIEGKIPYDFKKIEKSPKILNSEVNREEAIRLLNRILKPTIVILY